MRIDVHAHVLTERMMARLQEAAAEHAPRLQARHGDWAELWTGSGTYQPFPVGGWDIARRLADMDAVGVDVQVLGVVPFTYYYYLPVEVAQRFARIQNEEIAALCRQHPTRFVGLATLPMQAPELAAAELRYAMTELGLRGAALGTNIDGRNLDLPELEPVWAAAEELGAFLFVHPDRVCAQDRLGSYYLHNLIGNPTDTSIAIASLVFGGVVERHPRLVCCFAHGGGFIPYQQGRLLHGWRRRREPRARLQGSPAASLARLYFDTIVHSSPALRYLVQVAGAERVLLGSDYPFDMGPEDPVAEVLGADLSATEREAVLGGNAARLLGIPMPGTHRS